MCYLGKIINFAESNLSVSYFDIGSQDAPVIIFIHGFPLNKTIWNKQIEVLNSNYRLIAFDIRGLGESKSGITDFSIDLYVDDLIKLMDALVIKKATLCGLSLGGYIALNAIENFPDRFEGLILCDTSCIEDSPETFQKRMDSIENIKSIGIDKYADESIQQLFARDSFINRKPEIALVRDMIVQSSTESICNTLTAISKRNESCTKLMDIKVPTLILVGKQDKVTPPELSSSMHSRIRNSLFVQIENAGHLSNIENPYGFNFQLKKFLGTVYSKK